MFWSWHFVVTFLRVSGDFLNSAITVSRDIFIASWRELSYVPAYDQRDNFILELVLEFSEILGNIPPFIIIFLNVFDSIL